MKTTIAAAISNPIEDFETFIERTNWKLIQEQKETLLKIACGKITTINMEHIEGVINFLDSIQELAVEHYSHSEENIFPQTEMFVDVSKSNSEEEDIFEEVKNDYTDDRGYTSIDAYLSNAEEGLVVCWIKPDGEVQLGEFSSPAHLKRKQIKEAVEEVLKKLRAAEGWDLFITQPDATHNLYELQRNDEAGKFEDDLAAIRYVCDRAMTNPRSMHAEAIRFLFTNSPNELDSVVRRAINTDSENNFAKLLIACCLAEIDL
jgi:hypothetical protein